MTTTNATIEARTENGWEAYGLLDDADITFVDGRDENGRTAAQVAAACNHDTGRPVRVVTEDGQVLATTERRLQITDPTIAEWHGIVDNQPASGEQIIASDEAEAAGLGGIDIDPEGNVIRPGQFHTSDLLAVWVD